MAFVEDSNEKVTATFRKGRNKNIAARFEGETVGQHLASLENPFCMYVPGLAGIPFEEEIRTVGIVRRIAAKGDSNTVFRNVINLLSQDAGKWELFLSDLKVIFPAIDFTISANPNVDGSIDVRFQLNPSDPMLPIDLAGTGVLQAIQIAAYVNYFKVNAKSFKLTCQDSICNRLLQFRGSVNTLETRLKAKQCELCGSTTAERYELHHRGAVQCRRQGRRDFPIGTGQHSGRNGRDDPLVLPAVWQSVHPGRRPGWISRGSPDARYCSGAYGGADPNHRDS